MRVLFATMLAMFGLAIVVPTAGHAADWTTVWQDNFDSAAGTAVSSDWRYDTGTGFGTNEIEAMTDSTANVATDGNGNLAITPLRDGNGAWTSGRIETNRDDFQPPAGGALKLEARIQLPAVTGAAAAGYWPAFWSLGTPLRTGGSWPDVGEMDVMEDVNGQDRTYGTLHCGVAPGGPCNESTGLGASRACPDSPCPGNFHVYGFEWDRSVSPETLTWTVDGQAYHSVTASQLDATTWNHATAHGIYAIFDLAIGGDFPNGVAGQSTPTAATESGHPMLIDYVSVSTRT